MEPDRYRVNQKYYIIGMIFLAICLALFVFCAYIFPHLLFNWIYDVPEFIAHWRTWLQMNHGFSENTSSLLIFLFFFILALICAGIAYAASNTIEDEIYRNRTEVPPEDQLVVNEQSRMWTTLYKIAVVVLIAILIVVLLDLIVYHPPHPPHIPR